MKIRVKILQNFSCLLGGFSEGEIVLMPYVEAGEYITKGYAAYVDEPLAQDTKPKKYQALKSKSQSLEQA